MQPEVSSIYWSRFLLAFLMLLMAETGALKRQISQWKYECSLDAKSACCNAVFYDAQPLVCRGLMNFLLKMIFLLKATSEPFIHC